MSFIQNESTDSNDIENQFNNGIKMIVNAYETQTTFLSNEVIKLSKDLEQKQNKINELQELCQTLLNQKNSYENNIKNLSTENEKIKEQLNNLLIENNELKRVKQNILATIENTNNNNNNNSIQIKHNSKTLEQIYKNNSYKILNGRNKLKEEYNNSQNNINNKSLGSNGYSERLFRTTLKKGKTPINVNNFFNQNNKFINNNNNNKLDNISISNEYIKNKNNKSFSVEKMLNKTYYNKHLTKQNSPNKINYVNNSFSQKNINDDNNNNDNNNNSNETDFFKKCREIMSSTDYANMLDIVHMFNSKQINKQDTYTNILEILQKGRYNSLLEGFNNLFS